MAGGFNITAQIVLRGPANINQVVSQIQRQLGSINANVNVQMPNGLVNQFNNLINQVGSLNTSLSGLNKNSSLTKVASSAGRVAAPLKEAKTAAYQFGQSIGEAARKFTAFSIAAGAMVGVISTIRQGVSAAIDFQHELVRLEQIGGNVNNSIGSITAEITNLSTTLGSSSKELINVASTLRQAGLSAKDTQIALRGVAEAGLSPSFTEIKNTVEGAIVAMQTFGLQAKDLYGVLGSINRVSADFAVESDDITQALRKSGGAFKSAGGSLNELIALFTSVRSTTRESAEAISSGFNTIFARIQRPEAIEQLRLMGVNLRYASDEAKVFGKTEGEFVGPYEAVRRLNTALSSVPPASQEYAAIVELIGGFRQVSRVIPLIQQFGTSEKALQSAMSGTNSLTQSTIIAQKSLSNQLAAVGEQFLEVFRIIGENKQLQNFTKLALTLASTLATVAKAAAPLVPLLGFFATAKLGQALASPFTPDFRKGFGSGLSGAGKRLATGGVVPGVGNSDSVPANLTPGEFVIRKSAAKAIGYNRLHNMNRYAVGGTVKKNDNLFGEDEYSPLNERYMSDDEREKLKRQRMIADKMKKARISMSEAAKQHYARGGVVLGFKDAGEVSGDGKPVEQKSFLNKEGRGNTVYIKPPGGAVVMLVPDVGKTLPRSEADTLPVSNLAPDALKRFEADKAALVASGRISEKLSHGIQAVTTNIKVRPVDKGKAGAVRGIIENNILNALNQSASALSEPSMNATLTPADSQNVLQTAIGAQGFGRIFEGVLQVIGRKLGQAVSTSARAPFDFSPIDNIGFSGLFGADVQGLYGDAKINDTYASRASMISKALRQFGMQAEGSQLQNRGLSNPAFYDKQTKLRPVLDDEGNQVDRLTYARKRIGAKKKYAVGGRVSADPIKRFAAGGEPVGTDTVPALLTPGEFVINRDSAQRIGYNNLHRLNRYATGGTVENDNNLIFSKDGVAKRTKSGKNYLLENYVVSGGRDQPKGSIGQRTRRRRVELDEEKGELSTKSVWYAKHRNERLANRMSKLPPLRRAEGGLIPVPQKFVLGGFADRAKQFFKIKTDKKHLDITARQAEDFMTGGESPFNQAEVTKRLGKLQTFQPGLQEKTRNIGKGNNKKVVTANTLKIPFGNDKLAMVGKGLVGESGENILGGNISNLVKDLSPKPKEVLKDLGVNHVDAKITRHIISNEATKDFTDVVHQPVSNAIATVFRSRFNDAKGDYNFSKRELSGLEGLLLQKYIQAVSKTRLTGTNENALFDFPSGVSRSDNFNKIVLPSPITPGAFTDAKLNIATPTTTYSMIAKYINYRYKMLPGLVKGERPEQTVRGIEKAGLEKPFSNPKSLETLLLHKIQVDLNNTRERYQAIKDDPSKKEEYNALLDTSIKLVRQSDDLQKKMQAKYVGDYRAKRQAATPFAKGGKVNNTLSSFLPDIRKHRQPDYQRLLESPHAEDVSSHIPEGSKLIGYGVEAAAFKKPDNTAVRIGGLFSKIQQDRPKDKMTLQPYESKDYGNYRVEHLPYAPSLKETHGPSLDEFKTNPDEAEKKIKRLERITKAFEKRLISLKKQPTDVHTDNLARYKKKIVAIDPAIYKDFEKFAEDDDFTIGFNNGGKVRSTPRRFASGGRPTGTDTVPALLTPGEFVVRREAAQRIGYNQLHQMNRMQDGGPVKRKRYAFGGRVFEYDGTDPQGARVFRGRQEATSLQAARQLLENYGYTISRIDELVQHGPQPRSIAGADLSAGGGNPPTRQFPANMGGQSGGGGTPRPMNPQKSFTNLSAMPGAAPGGQFFANSPTNAAQGIGQPQFPQSMSSFGLKYKGVASGNFPEDMTSPRTKLDPVVTVLREILNAVKNTNVNLTRPSRTPNVATATQPNAPEAGSKFGGRLAQYGVGAAILGSQYLPQLSDKLLGTPEKPTEFGRQSAFGGYSRSEIGQGLSGAVAGAATGAAVGAIGGPIVAGIAAIAFGAQGLASSLGEAAEAVRNVKLDKELTKLSNSVARATSNNEPLTSDVVGDFRQGIQSILSGADKSSNRDQFLAEKVNTSDISQMGNKIVSEAGITSRDDQSEQIRKFLNAGQGAGRDVANILTQLPENKENNLSQVLKPILEQGRKQAFEKERSEEITKLARATEIQVRLFDKFGQSLAKASSSLALLDDRANSFITLSEGQYTPQSLKQRSVSAENFGTGIDVSGVENAIDFITKPIEGFGGDLAKNFNSTAKHVNKALDILPDVLIRVVKGGVNAENFSKKVRDTLNDAVKLPENVTSQFQRAISTFDLPDLLKRVTTDIDGVTDELIKKSFPNLSSVIQNGAKQLEDSIQSYQAGLSKYQDIGNKVGEAQDRVSSLQTEAFAFQRKTLARRTGFVSHDTLSPAERNVDFQRTQQRLTGNVGTDAVNPTLIANQLRNTISRISTLQAEQRDASPEVAKGLEVRLSDLGSSAGRLNQALQKLANPVERNAALQEKLNAINAEEAQRLSLAERLAGASPQEMMQINRTANVTAGVARGQIDFRALNDEFRKGILAFTHDLEDIRTPILQGLTGKEFREALLRNVGGEVSSTALLPRAQEGQRGGIENKIAANFNDAIKAQAELANIMKSENIRFFDELGRNQKAFMDEFARLTLNAERRDIQNNVNASRAKVETGVNQQAAAKGIRDFGFSDLNQARDFTGRGDFKAVSEKINEQNSVEKRINNFKGLNFPSIGYTITPPTQTFDHEGGVTTTSGSTALSKTGENTLKSFLSSLPELNFEQKDVTSVIDKTNKSLVGKSDASSDEVKSIINNSIKSVFSDIQQRLGNEVVSLSNDISRKTGVDRGQTRKVAEGLPEFQGLLKTLEGIPSFDALNTQVSGASAEFIKLQANLFKLNNGFLPDSVAKTGVATPPRVIDASGGIDILRRPVERRADGGSIFAPRGTDTVPAMLTPGEFVVNAKAARANIDVLKRINSSRGTSYYADGGEVNRRKRKKDDQNIGVDEQRAVYRPRRTREVSGEEGSGYGPKSERFLNLPFDVPGFPSLSAANQFMSDVEETRYEKGVTQLSNDIPTLKDEAKKHSRDIEDFKKSGLSDYKGLSQRVVDIKKSYEVGTKKFRDETRPIKRDIYNTTYEFHDNQTKNTQRQQANIVRSDKAISNLQDQRVSKSPELFPQSPLFGFEDRSSATGGVSIEDAKKNALEDSRKAGRLIDSQPIAFSAKVEAPQPKRRGVSPEIQQRMADEVVRTRTQQAYQRDKIAETRTREANRIVLPDAQDHDPFFQKGIGEVNPLPDYDQIARRIGERKSRQTFKDNTPKLIMNSISSSISGLPNLNPFGVSPNNEGSRDNRLFALRHPNAARSQTPKPIIDPLDGYMRAPTPRFKANTTKVQPTSLTPDSRDQRTRLIQKRRARKHPAPTTLAKRFGLPEITQPKLNQVQSVTQQASSMISEIRDAEDRKKRHLPQINRPRGFADGGFASGTDVVPAMLTPGEFIVSRDAARANMTILNEINQAKGRVIYRADGGPVSSNGVKSSSGNLSLSAESITQMRGFNDTFSNSLGQLNQAMGGFTTAVGVLNGFASNLQNILNPLTVMGQTFQTLVPTFTQFNAAAQTLAGSFTSFSNSANQFAEAARLLSAMPATITHTIQGNNTLTVVHSVPEVLKSLGDELARNFIQKAVDQITSDMKSGKILQG